MAKEFNDEWNELTQGSKLSKFLFILNWFFLGFAVLSFISGHWKFGLLFLKQETKETGNKKQRETKNKEKQGNKEQKKQRDTSHIS